MEEKNKTGDEWEKQTKAFIGWNVSPIWVNANKLVNRFVDKDDAYLMSGRKAVNAKNLKNTNEIFTGDIIGLAVQILIILRLYLKGHIIQLHQGSQAIRQRIMVKVLWR